MINKTARNIIFAISAAAAFCLLLWFIGAAGTGLIKYSSSEDSELKIYKYYGSSGCLYLMEKNHIPVDKTYKDNLRKH